MMRISLLNKLAIDKFEVTEGEPHIVIENIVCKSCQDKRCLYVCPAGLYSEQKGEIIVEWAGCLECGTCLAVCSKKAISWKYPQGGFGVIYRLG